MGSARYFTHASLFHVCAQLELLKYGFSLVIPSGQPLFTRWPAAFSAWPAVRPAAGRSLSDATAASPPWLSRVWPAAGIDSHHSVRTLESPGRPAGRPPGRPPDHPGWPPGRERRPHPGRPKFEPGRPLAARDQPAGWRRSAGGGQPGFFDRAGGRPARFGGWPAGAAGRAAGRSPDR